MSVVVPLMLPTVAVMTELPAATPVARPADPDALEIVAALVVALVHVALLVRFCVELSE